MPIESISVHDIEGSSGRPLGDSTQSHLKLFFFQVHEYKQETKGSSQQMAQIQSVTNPLSLVEHTHSMGC